MADGDDEQALLEERMERLRYERERFRRSWGREPTVRELAAELGMLPNELIAVLATSSGNELPEGDPSRE